MTVSKKSSQPKHQVAPQTHTLLCDLKGPRGLHVVTSRSGLSPRESVERAYRFADDLARDLAPDFLRCETLKSQEDAKIAAATAQVFASCACVFKDRVFEAQAAQAPGSVGDASASATKKPEKSSDS